MYEPIKNTYTYDTISHDIEYIHTDSFDHLPKNSVRQCIAVAFHNDKIILVNNVNKPGVYVLIGGSVEEGEDLRATIIREIQEESNMNVIHSKPIGYQKVSRTDGEEESYYQIRYFCIVEPHGPFVTDPDGDVTEVLEIDPDEHKRYFDWGVTSDAIMERAMEFKREYDLGK